MSYVPAKSGGSAGWNDPPPMNSMSAQKQLPLKKYPRPVDPSCQNAANFAPPTQYPSYANNDPTQNHTAFTGGREGERTTQYGATGTYQT
uniref:Distal-less n=1 Tax=Panagrolaimus sp. ES5 TaxID=591445 RepID=A0AC34F774_9BILA